MKKFIVLSIVLLMIVGFAITSSARDLVVGRERIPVGTLEVLIETVEPAPGVFEHFLVVRYFITVPEWELLETHLYVGTVEPTKSAPGRFPYGPESDHIVIDEDYFVEYFIPLTDFMTNSTLPANLYIAAQAEIGMVDEFGDPVLEPPEIGEQIEETTWAYGVDEIRPGKNWAMYFEFDEFELPNSE